MTIVGVAWRGDEADMQEFVQRHAITFANMIDDDGALFAKFGIPFQPGWVFVAADGTADTHLGALGDDDLAAALNDLDGGY